MVDSTALFKSRCLATGLTDAAHTALTDKGWGTLGTFAFCASNSPATVTDAVFAEKVAQPILGDRDHADVPKLRRLHFEAYTTVSAELKRRVESSEQDAPRKLPPQEISERLEALQKKVIRLKLQNALEPSHSLINMWPNLWKKAACAKQVHDPQSGGQQLERGPVSQRSLMQVQLTTDISFN